MLVATPHCASDDLITYHGTGITVDEAIADLSQHDVLEYFESQEMHHRENITVRVFTQVTPVEAGWGGDSGFDWALGEFVEERNVTVSELNRST